MVVLEAEAKGYIGSYQEGWPKLAPSTIAEKTALGYAPPDNPLLRTGDMRDSIEHQTESTGDGALGIIGSNDEAAKFHEIGTSRMPPRPFLALAMMRSEAPAAEIFGAFAVEILEGK
jgi:HK97 gp10 family phage protein